MLSTHKSQSESLCALKEMYLLLICSGKTGRLLLTTLHTVPGYSIWSDWVEMGDLQIYCQGSPCHSCFPQSQEALCFGVKLSIACGRQFSSKSCFGAPRKSLQRFQPSTSWRVRLTLFLVTKEGRRKKGRDGGYLSLPCNYLHCARH